MKGDLFYVFKFLFASSTEENKGLNCPIFFILSVPLLVCSRTARLRSKITKCIYLLRV